MSEVVASSPINIPLKCVSWPILNELPWRENACKGQVLDFNTAKFIYIAMRPPRSIRRCQHELDFLGFKKVTNSTLRSWQIKGDWTREAMLSDMGQTSIEELQRRVAGLRDAALVPLVDSLSEVMQAALDVEKIEKAVEKAADKGDVKGIMDAAKTAAELISYVVGTSEQASAPAPQVHQHLHAHVDGAGAGDASAQVAVPGGSALARVLSSPFDRVKEKLERAAAEKRATGLANGRANGKSNGAVSDHNDS